MPTAKNEEADTREKLEADIRRSLGFTVKDVFGWLDRQAAITERDYVRREYHCKVVNDNAKLPAKVLEEAARWSVALRDLARVEGQGGAWAHARKTRQHGRTREIEERHGDFYCTGCGELVGSCDTASELYIDGNAVQLWNYCPNCGAKVVGE